MVINAEKLIQQARNKAAKATPWILKHDRKTYTAVFNQNEWVYDVFEDGFFMMKINIKSPRKAKQFLSSFLVS